MAWYGGLAGHNSKFRVVMDMRTSSQGESAGYVQIRRYIEVVSGSFGGSHVSTNWGWTVQIYGAGVYGDTGWQNLGNVNYGSSTTQGSWARYTGNSGTVYNSSVNGTYSPSIPSWAPRSPTNIVVTRSSNTQSVIKWANNPTTARKYQNVKVQRSTDNGSFVNIATLSGTTTSYTDNSTTTNHFYVYRVVAVNGAGSAASTNSATIYNTPNPCTNVVNTRNSDSKNTITWTRGTTVAGVYGSILVRRKVDSGAWSDLVTLSGTATSYADTTAQANHAYQYAVIARNSAGSSSVAYSGTTYNTPAAPTSVTAARKAETTVTITIANPAITATTLEIQRSTDGSTWTTVKTVSGIVRSVEDTPGGGTFWYRCRNTRGSLASAWTQAKASVVTICAPNAPSLTYPANSVVIPLSETEITFRWTHNPIDGSAQTQAELQYSTDSGSTWTTVTITGSSNSYTLTNNFALNSTVKWRVRTKGVHANFGAYSQERTFNIYQVPSVVIDDVSDNNVIETTPITIDFDYLDNSGVMTGATLNIIQSGDIVYTRELESTQVLILSSEWLPENGATYTIQVIVRSSSTLQATGTKTVQVDFIEPKIIALGFIPDLETGYIEISLQEEYDDDRAAVVSANVYRVTDDERVLIAEDVLSELTIVDKYAPINREFYYESVSFADSGAIHAQRYTACFKSRYAYFYYQDKVAKAIMQPTGSIKLSSPNQQLVRYAGRKYPVSYDDDCIDETRSFAADLETRDEAQMFYDLVNLAKGQCVHKSLDGSVIHAKCSVTLNPAYTNPGIWGSVSVDITRIDGDAL